jgi:hypothetical protein
LLLCHGKRLIGSVTTPFPSFDCGLEGVLDDFEETTEKRSIGKRREGANE